LDLASLLRQDLVEHDGVIAQIMDGESLWLMNQDRKMVYKPKQVTFHTNSIWAFDQVGLVRVLPDIVHIESLYLVAHQDLKRSMRIRAVFDYLVGAFKEDAAFFKGLSNSQYEFKSCGINVGQNMLPPRIHQPKSLPAAAE